ncbi:MAG TPA: hypothetical protein VGG64_26755 [Pirellulales bacterium]|jgi:hypothetical protein
MQCPLSFRYAYCVLVSQKTVIRCLTAVLLAASASLAHAGPFDPQVGQPGALGIPAASPLFTEWASSVASLNRGPEDIANPSLGLASVGTASNALGSPVGNASRVVSLGDGGSITVGFNMPIKNGPGPDLAVFENGFLSGGASQAFLELATVAVSSDGTNFFTFPDVSDTQTTTQVGGSGLLDASNLYDLAGKYIAGYGTGFDLSELANVSPLLNVNDITAVRITDVVGSIDPQYGTKDSLGNLINDPFPTPFTSSGFDLNAVGAINVVPEPSGLFLGLTALVAVGALKITRSHRRV